MDFSEEDLENEELLEDDYADSGSIPENPEPSDDELLKDNEPEEGNPELGYSKVKGPLTNVKGVANSKFAKFLLSHGWIIPLILFIILSLIILVHFQMDFDLFGVGDPKPTYFSNTPACGKVYLTWENPAYTEARQKVEKDYVPISDPLLVILDEEDEYGKRYIHEEYDYNTYILGIVWNDNHEAKDIDNEVVYQAMAIATRSKLLSQLANNCVVLKNYNEQASHFVKLKGTEEKYLEVKQAVANSLGLVMVRDGNIISAEYDAFLYNKKREEEDESQNRVYFYHMAHKNNEESLKIHAKWVDNIEKEKGESLPKVQTSDIKKMTSLSLYGARYLLEREDANYELYRILKYFYGQDIEFYTIEQEKLEDNLLAVGDNDCMWWPIGSQDTTVGEDDGLLYAKGKPFSTRITSGFGGRDKVNGVDASSTNHMAIDIGGPSTGFAEGIINIIASNDGVVIQTVSHCIVGDHECGSHWGNYILIKHENGLSTRYAHLYSLSVRVGEHVKQGQVIGKMGNTGASNGTHLHFEVIEQETRVNPLNYVSTTRPRPEECGLTPSPLPLPPTGSSDGKESICVAFLNAGYSPEQTAGVMINAYDESRFNPNAFNPSGGGIGAYGLFQWRADRQRRLKVLKDYTTAPVQALYALSELNSTEDSAKRHLLAASSAGNSAFNFCKYYERPGSDSYCTSRENNSLLNEFLNYAKNGCK